MPSLFPLGAKDVLLCSQTQQLRLVECSAMTNLMSALTQLEQERTRLASQLDGGQSRYLPAKRNRQAANGQIYFGCGWSSDRRCSARSVGQGQGTESSLNLCQQTQDVTSRPETHCRGTESTLGEMEKGKADCLKDMVTDTLWGILRIELQKEVESIFASSGEIVLIESTNESSSELVLSNRTATLKLKESTRFHAIRWETDTEYGFKRTSQPIAQLARTLMKRLPCQ